jgi:hypothetical protein
MKGRKFYSYLMLLLVLLPFLSIFIRDVRGQEVGTSFTGKIVVDNPNLITDSHWDWYGRVVDIGEVVSVTVNYSGALDLDVRLYWARENVPGFHGFDLSHCPINSSTYKYAQTSQFRTNNTSTIGEPEEVHFRNDRYVQEVDQEAYILIFAFSGVGESDYTIQSSLPIERIHDDFVYDCNMALMMLLIYSITAGCVAGAGSYLIYRKKVKLITPDEEKDKFDKREQKEREVIDLDKLTAGKQVKKKEK